MSESTDRKISTMPKLMQALMKNKKLRGFPTLRGALKYRKGRRIRGRRHHRPPRRPRIKVTITEESDSEHSDDGSNSEYSDDEESQKDYRKGGYHPMSIGDILNNRYVVERKLGFGYFSTVWLASDKTKSEMDPRKLVAIKVQKSAEHYADAAIEERKILNALRENPDADVEFLVNLLDFFPLYGPNGKHFCLVFETMWKDLFYLLKMMNHQGLPPNLIKIIIYQSLRGVAYLHSKNIIHTDLKPENFLLTMPLAPNVREIQKARLDFVKEQQREKAKASLKRLKNASLNKNQRRRLKAKIAKMKVMEAKEEEEKKESQAETQGETKEESKGDRDGKSDHSPAISEGPQSDPTQLFLVKVADLGNACWINKPYSKDVQTRQYRAPEVLLGYPYSTPIDVFSLGIMLVELATGDCIFNPKRQKNVGVRNQEHLALMMRTLGNIPRRMIKDGSFGNSYFSRYGRLRHAEHLKPLSLQDILRKYEFPETDIEPLCDLAYQLLNVDPRKRVTAQDALLHPWLSEVHHDFLEHGTQSFPYPDLRGMIREQQALERERCQDDGADDDDSDDDRNNHLSSK